MRSRRHASLSTFLALIMLVAQFGAQAHAYTHLAKQPDTVERRGHPAPCVECSAFAPLLAAVSGDSYPTIAAVVEPPAIAATLAAGIRAVAACTAYRSRAPPAPAAFV
ncbi:MAG: hypothetical protein KGL25_14645 [Gammaproteobacteria bacterium]|nr:hypothetical protein [Gammaproteobacteria bacterium]MDE2252633.1 hypothetical protein [Gammaproteobacteria bacterium]